MRKQTLIWILVFLISINLVFAFGIRPAKKSVQYIPGQVQNHSFRITNEQLTKSSVEISTSGELEHLMIIPENFASFDTAEHIVEYRLDFTKELSPGVYEGKIIVEQLSPEDQSQISAKLALSYKVIVTVPPPKKYLDAEFSLAESEDDYTLILLLENSGNQNIEEAKAVIELVDILDSSSVKTFEPESSSLTVGSSKTFEFILDKKEILPGRYNANIMLSYDKESRYFNESFNIGKPEIDLTIPNSHFTINTMNKFDVVFENLWNQKFSGVYATIEFYDGPSKLSELRTHSFEIDPRQKKIVEAYWDTTNFTFGGYDAHITIHSGNYTKTNIFSVNIVSEDKQHEILLKQKTRPFIFIFAVLILTLIIMVYLLLRNTKKRKI